MEISHSKLLGLLENPSDQDLIYAVKVKLLIKPVRNIQTN